MKFLIVSLMCVLLAGCGESTSPQQPTKAAASPPPAPPTPPKAPDEDAAIAALKKVNEAQAGYFHRNRRYALSYEELRDALFLPHDPDPAELGYDIKMRPAATAVSYTMSAVPIAPTPTARHFFTDQSGIIRAEEGKDATAKSPKISK